VSDQHPPLKGSGISPVTTRGRHDYTVYRGRDAQPDPRQLVERVHARLAALGRLPLDNHASPEQDGENA
jgi:hypothetical protein